ncbi:hypothetical protein BY996DRAFT_4589073 [Phakopsora pachyrhizi]|uniref:Uncharacterized protein n=1 Tax=Phakopsora pachyrhizi TaxID=170000 RepID=A0AAV0BS27_PHAPC|nr:hypothetical protein BY996DRAFT_4600532 [Phakopsora pachyrhizi]KAI8449504.1 hypothetical protein BY996DRAFT_4589073 [Phakopsora pachyrhizi]CAH7689571.1 hypothetical protein PPACK8108_LOCUS24677 [Phakopsora pachyrhizi]
MSAITQTAKGAAVAGGLYFLLHSYIANRSQLISKSLSDLTNQFSYLTIQEANYGNNSKSDLFFYHQRLKETMAERIKFNWNQNIRKIYYSIYDFDPINRLNRFYIETKNTSNIASKN